MPHAMAMPFSGFQALILCGPGVSLNTFTANPEDFPKALVPIANRPMIWYPLEWCHRMGITSTRTFSIFISILMSFYLIFEIFQYFTATRLCEIFTFFIRCCFHVDILFIRRSLKNFPPVNMGHSSICYA